MHITFQPFLLAEKLETVVSRGDQNTRARDYYDIYILTRLRSDNLDLAILRDALKATAERRGTATILRQYKDIMQSVLSSDVMNRRWDDYKRNFDYAAGIAFSDACDAVVSILEKASPYA